MIENHPAPQRYLDRKKHVSEGSSRTDSRLPQRIGQFFERRFVNLGYTALVDAQHAAYFFHGELIGVIEQHNPLIALG